jgi:hypothetical protein
MANPLTFTMQQQKQTNWCWAAVATSVADFLGNLNQWTQCKLSNQQLTQTTCCSDGANPNTCNKVSFLENSLLLVQHTSPATPLHAAASEADIKREIDAGRPIGVRIGWNNSGDQGHFVLVTGYVDSPTGFLIVVNDPEKPDGTPGSTYSYTEITQTGYLQKGTWSYTYFTG